MSGITVAISAIFAGAVSVAFFAIGTALRDYRAKVIAVLTEPIR